MSRYGFDFRKRFGQNFLVDEGVILRALQAAGVGKGDVVFEVGPGIGTLTQYLCEAAKEVVSIEVDRNLIPILSETLADYDNVEVINDDVLKVDLNAEAMRHSAGRGQEHPLKIVANLPYYITTPILMNFFKNKVPARSVTVMVQQEVAQRMTAQPGTKDYGSLSVAVQYYSAPRIVESVPPSSFIPSPKVTSAVVTMELYDEPLVKPDNEELFLAVSRAAFGQRRKTLVNALASSREVPYGKEQAALALGSMGLDLAVRGEKLSLEEFARLSDELERVSCSADLDQI